MRGRFDLRPVVRLVRIVRREGYRILHAHTPRTALVAGIVSLLTATPLVYHVHSPASRDSTHRWRNRLNALLERACLAWASALIAVSESLGRHTRRQGFADRPRHRGSQRRRLSDAARRPAGGIARNGRSAPWPCSAHAREPRSCSNRLRGSGPKTCRSGSSPSVVSRPAEYERHIKDRVAELGLTDVVEWTGFTRDVDRELARMDLFVLPSLFGEGLPMVVLEAMAAGRSGGRQPGGRHPRDDPRRSRRLAHRAGRPGGLGSGDRASRPRRGRLAVAPPERACPTRRALLRSEHGGRRGRGVPPRAGSRGTVPIFAA